MATSSRDGQQLLKLLKQRTTLFSGPSSDNMNEIIPGLYLGALEAAYEVEDLRKAGVTHVLTAMTFGIIRLEPGRLKDFTTLQIEINDLATFNIARYLPESIEFIDGALSDGGKVLVHCFAGVSRSATVVAAYLMAKRDMSPKEALDYMRERRPVVGPNQGFLKQLDLFHQAGCVYVEDEYPVGSRQNVINWISSEPATRIRCKRCRRMLATKDGLDEHHRSDGDEAATDASSQKEPETAAEAVVELELAVGVAKATEALSELSTSDTSNSASLSNSSTTTAANESRVVTSSAPSSESSPGPPPPPPPPPPAPRTVKSKLDQPQPPTPMIQPRCSGYFLDPQQIPWLQAQAEAVEGEVEGKVSCPNTECRAKIGNWSWVGVRCSCGGWVVPGFCLARAKVDQTR
ncbi:protein-tyrosine phosphatase-like protein [Auriculariales sp. MPI-PUGE-AT-0066]|nr:protein-tyrosine phosphatase-like protein [Auriculariales sp. MPI-PUGE-AT-0066]